MKLENTFTVPLPAGDAWPVLLDLERIAPCVPGAVITPREGDDFHGRTMVKPAQFGRSALADVATTLIDRFAADVADEISTSAQRSAPDPTASAADTPAADEPAPTCPRPPAPPPEPIDLFQATGIGGNQKLMPAAAGLLAAFVAFRRRR
ncbi:hypothetical protein [Nocardia brevicatena]|uniref:hypothetical protein n=1 Tax=Nocardia brevicatena TaxID=37327 RepID=UPI0002DA49FE|nr:hypothetical protein [Nocardia brevicatena]